MGYLSFFGVGIHVAVPFTFVNFFHQFVIIVILSSLGSICNFCKKNEIIVYAVNLLAVYSYCLHQLLIKAVLLDSGESMFMLVILRHSDVF